MMEIIPRLNYYQHLTIQINVLRNGSQKSPLKISSLAREKYGLPLITLII